MPWRHLPPPAFLAASLLFTILLGSCLLQLPAARAVGAPSLGWLDALFTATSAACVTGLVVVDTGTQFSFFGQLVILLLIQVGGLGVMTIGTTVLLALGQRPTAAVRQLLTGMASHRPAIQARDIIGMVFVATLVAELLGAGLLFLVFVGTHPVSQALWLAVFHSVSAFCNAGFSPWSDSLSRYVGDPMVNLTMMGLIIGGGLGFVVLVELYTWTRSRLQHRDNAYARLSLHSRIVLSTTVVAVVGGTCLFAVLEMQNSLAGRSWSEQLLIASFQSVTARTAGFNTVDIAGLANPTLLVLIGLMFIGAGPGSMAGGIKLTSAMAVLAFVVHRMRGNRQVSLFGRAIGELTLQRAVVHALLAALLIGITVGAIEVVRASGSPTSSGRGELFDVIFEVVSAFGTVGLSMGMTAKLESLTKVLLIGQMFIGRLGPLLLMDFFERLPSAPPLHYAKEELMVG